MEDTNSTNRIIEIFQKLEDRLQFRTLNAISALAEQGEFQFRSGDYEYADEIENLKDAAITENCKPLIELGFLAIKNHLDGQIVRLHADVAEAAKAAITPNYKYPYLTSVSAPQREQSMAEKYASGKEAGRTP